jgi:hypothetical protein
VIKLDRKITLCYIVLLACALFMSYMVGVVTQKGLFHRNPAVSANVYFYEGAGASAHLIAESGNLITDLGENVSLFGLMNDANYELVAISTGNASSITADLTILDTEATDSGFDRVACNVSAYWLNSNDISVNFTASFDASAQISVNSVGLHWDITDNLDETMYAASFITDGTQHQFPLSTPASRLTVVWVLTFNAN